MMRREALLAHLALAERHVSEGYATIERQRGVIRDFQRRGDHWNRIEAERLLAQFEEAQLAHIAHRDRLRIELARLSG